MQGIRPTPTAERGRGSAPVAWASVAAIVGCSLLLLVLAARLRSTVGPLRVDAWVARHLVGPRPGGPRAAGAGYRWIARIGAPGFACLTTMLALAWAGRRRDWRGGLLAVASPGLALVVAELVIKPVVARKINADDLIFVFPSGTVAVVAACVASTVTLVHRWAGRSRAVLAALGLGLFALVVSVAVIEVHWHYATDVIGGLAVGGTAVLVVARILTASERPIAVAAVHRTETS